MRRYLYLCLSSIYNTAQISSSLVMLMVMIYQSRQIGHRAVTFENTFGDDESARQRSPTLPALLADAFQDFLQTLHVIMVEPADSATRDLEALLNRKVDVPVGNDDIPSFGEGRNDGRNCRERLGVEDGIFRSEEIRNVLLEVGVNVNRAVETCRTAASETVFPESLCRLLLDVFIASETREVEAGEVHDSLSGSDEFGFGTCRAGNNRKRGEVQTFSLGERLFKWFWSPFVNEFIDFLVMTCMSVRAEPSRAHIRTFSEN